MARLVGRVTGICLLLRRAVFNVLARQLHYPNSPLVGMPRFMPEQSPQTKRLSTSGWVRLLANKAVAKIGCFQQQ